MELIQHCLRLQYHPRRWKLVRGILLYKTGKPRDFMKSYRVICLLECIGKILEKIVANELSRICEKRSLLHPEQIGTKKNRSVVNIITLLIHEVQSRWKKGEKAAVLFINVKGAFDHVSKKKLAERMTNLGLDGDLVG